MQAVADRLGNTPAVARKSYVHPVLVAILTGERVWPETAKAPRRSPRRLTATERGLLALLSGDAALH
jgi:DNA topoisomerase-1